MHNGHIDRSEHRPERTGRLHPRQLRRRLSGQIFGILKETPEAVVVGPDPLIAHFSEAQGIDPETLASCQILVDDLPLTVVGVPNRIWYGAAMLSVHRIKESMMAVGRTCVLIPQRALDGIIQGTRSGATHSGNVLIQVIRAASDLDATDSCRHGHDPTGCLAVELSTGIPCLG